MRKFNLASSSPNPEGEDPDTTFEGAEGTPPGGGGKARRLLVIVGAVVIVVGGGYIALTQFTQFLGPKPQPPARPVRPIAKAPALPAGSPPAGAPAPTKQPAVPAGQAAPGPAAPTKAIEAQKAAPPSAAPPVAGQAATAPPTKTEAKAPAAKTAGPTKVAKAAPPEAQATVAPPPARPAPAAPQAAAGSFSIQVGAMVSESNAQRLKQRLEQLGYAPVIRKGKVHLRRHVVTTGDFTDRSGADEAAKRLAAQGIAARVTGSGGRFVVEAGSFANEDDAIDLARQLQRLNFPPRIQDRTQDATVYQVRVGSFPSRAEAKAKGAELEGKGFRHLVVKN